MLSEVRTSPPEPCPAPFNLVPYLLAREADLPDKIALQVLRLSGSERWSYGRLAREVRGITYGLAALDLPRGTCVLLRVGNSVEFPLAFLSCVGAGLLPVACPAGLTEAEVTLLAAETDSVLIIAAPGISLPAGFAGRVLSTDALREMADGPEADARRGDPGRPAYLVYTSGTSGRPRAVVHAHRAIWARRAMRDGWLGLGEGDRLLHAGAMNWTFTLGAGLFDPWAAGATALVPEPGLKSADLPILLRRHDATLFAAAPGVYRQMLKSHPRLDLPRLRHGLSAGEKLSPDIRAAWTAATGTEIHEAFGMSECSTFISSCPRRPAPVGTIGWPQDGRHVAVLDADGHPVSRGAEGTLAVHRNEPGLFLGYHGHAAEARARFCGDWFVTGDQAVMREDGAITYLGRSDDMMNAGGFRVSPLEVEATLAALPDVGDVVVAEVSPQPGTSFIVAFYTGPASPETLQAHAQTSLAPYKRPRTFQRIGRLALTPAGKVNRRALREEWTARK
jgi:acyl-coenzyme A synthetase/AMP-(fatty) acid ligase